MSKITAAGNPVRMIRPRLDNIPNVDVPPGFAIRAMNIEESDSWNNIVLGAEQWLTLSKNLFFEEFSQHFALVPQRCFFAVTPEDKPVGTASAWIYKIDEVDFGLIHWVAVSPDYQGIGIGKGLMCYTMKQMQNWHDRAILNTHSKRLTAIRLYLDLGFLPDAEYEQSHQYWMNIKSNLDHPTLNALKDY